MVSAIARAHSDQTSVRFSDICRTATGLIEVSRQYSALISAPCGGLRRAAYEQETRKIILSMDKVSKVSPQGKPILNGVGLGAWTHCWCKHPHGTCFACAVEAMGAALPHLGDLRPC